MGKKEDEREQIQSYLKKYQIESIFTEEVMPHLTLYRFKQGEFICTQGDASNVLFFLVEGKVKIHTTSQEGKTLVLSFKVPLDAIGDVEYAQKKELLNTVEAVSPVCMIGVPYRILDQYLKDNTPFLQFMLGIISKKFYIKSKSMSFNLMYPVEVRFASYLLSVIYEDNTADPGGKLKLSTLTDIANLIGTSYRHLNRVIHKFSEDGLVERSKGYLLIKKRDKLLVLANHNIYENN
ncbi:Crp/Fnr family transcriptional regulator [Paenibacillus sp. N1-5-1-14]|uniref:Crp/Fnr family transcriptional regulator n=1 Tax=Paenibacillus radicibacter TaxID=2972488 RepID=UPI002159A094|nr:Crp/Fnr family transcriptional regulator [Paenibacillus radicibacter]MCR8645238.1 Crp/Fnr family transcriptional regulator [Paenibacillus radicibacter]